MRLLIDTHSLIWYVDQDHLLGRAAYAAIADPANDLWVSAATAWEIAIKVSLGKLTLSRPYRAWIEKALFDLRAAVLPITVGYADVQVALPLHHRDPFDRMLIAQATVEGIAVVSADGQFDAYGVARIW
jgi:PIN domain nuclease of toxin-antitoxin system